ncbi:MAG: hypothetical protein GX890_00545 [Firmicutes bacterium]|nr:hypothetical protein [Bacillota bacterium]HPU00674.1 hypothetical protein [Bacillota bacterium]
MTEMRWHKVLLVALLALALFFGANHLYRRYFQQEPFIEAICRLEGVAGAELVSEGGGETLLITPDDSYQGRLQALVAAVEKEMARRYRKPLSIEIKDRRTPRLERFADAVSPDLFEAARSGSYRAAADRIARSAAEHGLDGSLFTVDSRRLYLQARDGSGYLYLIVPLPGSPEGEGGSANA